MASQEYADILMAKHESPGSESILGSRQLEMSELETGQEQLDNVGKLKALYNDPRAQFLPPTHTEKSEALPLLDYLPQVDVRKGKGHPARTAGKLQEVFLHQKKIFSRDYGLPREEAQHAAVEAVRSIVCGYGDFLLNAIAQHNQLNDLKSTLDGVSPRLTLTEVAGTDHTGIPAFVRYFDLVMLMKSKHPVPGVDILSPIIDRTDERDEHGRAKQIHDQYTGPIRPDAVDHRIQDLASTLTVGSIRTSKGRGSYNLLDTAIINEVSRRKFWMKRLEESRNHLAARVTASAILDMA
jgi:hypothetical protein